MIAHTTLPVKDYLKSKQFYIKVLAPLGYTNNMEESEAAGFFDGQDTDMWIVREDKVLPSHLAFKAKNKKEVEDFYKVGLAEGARDNGAPGYRNYWPGYYAAFIIDPDGHNIEAVWYDYSKIS